MKKLVSILVVLALMLPIGAWACNEETDIAKLIISVKAESYSSVTFSDSIYLPTTEDHKIAGIKDEDEQVRCIGIQNVTGKWISGRLDNGWARASLAEDGRGEAVAVKTIIVDGNIIGLTKYDNITCTIFSQYLEFAQQVADDLFGCEVILCNSIIGAGMLWWTGEEYVSAICAPSYADRIVIGTMSFNGGEDITPLCVSMFGGKLHFALMCGYWESSNVTVESSASAEAVAGVHVEVSATATAGAYAEIQNNGYMDQSGDGCNRNNATITNTTYNTYQIGFFNFVKNCYKKLMGECQ